MTDLIAGPIAMWMAAVIELMSKWPVVGGVGGVFFLDPRFRVTFGLRLMDACDDDEERPRGCVADARQWQDKSTSGTRPREKVQVQVRHAGSSAQRTIARKIAQPHVRDTRTVTNVIHLHKGQ